MVQREHLPNEPTLKTVQERTLWNRRYVTVLNTFLRTWPALKMRDSYWKRCGVVVRAKKKLTFDVDKFLATKDGGRSILAIRKSRKVFSQGDPADAVFYIQEGKVKICVVSKQGKEAVVAIHGEGDFFGEGCLSGQSLRLATAVAMTQCVVTRIDKAAMVRVLHTEPLFSERFMSHLLARNSRVEEDLVDQLFNSSEKRLARTLLLMANFGKEGSPERVITKVSQETLAEIIGTTRSRVSVFMNKFRKLGLISYNGHIEIHRSLLNMVLHETPAIARDKASEK
jgi:CRP/FNR family cyclic AMP-dependent transcriptional regulator